MQGIDTNYSNGKPHLPKIGTEVLKMTFSLEILTILNQRLKK